MKSRHIDLRLSHLPLPPRGIQWSAGLAAPPAPPAGHVGWTPSRSGGHSSAWHPELPALTGTASSVCWGRGRSLHLQAERTSSDWSSLKSKNNMEELVNVWDNLWWLVIYDPCYSIRPLVDRVLTSAISGEVQQQDVGAEVGQVFKRLQVLLQFPVRQFGLEDGRQMTEHVGVQRRWPAVTTDIYDSWGPESLHCCYMVQ